MPDESKITFGPDYRPQPSTAAVDLTVIAEEIRKSFTLGFDKAIEFYQVTIQPPPQLQAPQRLVMPGEPEEEEYGSGVLDMNSLAGMTPEAQEAVLRAHGLQLWTPPAPEPDPTHAEVGKLIKGEAPTSAESEE